MRLQLLLLSAVLASMAGCTMEVEGEEDVGLDQIEQINFNQINFNQINFNGFVASQDSLEALIGNPMATATYGPGGPLPFQLNNADTRVFMKYLANCALDPDDPVIEFTDLNGKLHTFSGGIGLCSDWAYGPPDLACQEIVSACMLSLNNAYAKSKMISQRGVDHDDDILETDSAVRAKTTSITGSSIASFNPCKATLSGEQRNCGWSAASSYLGTCKPGAEVTMNCKAESDEMVVRFCDGVEGCGSTSSTNLGQGVVCGGSATSIEFECGPDGAFAVMTGPVTANQKFDGGFGPASGGVYPATELALFPRREGAFFGNIFAPAARTHDIIVNVLPNGQITTDFLLSGTINVFNDSYACHDQNWTTPDAYMSDRLCAIVQDTDLEVAQLCVAKHIGACFGGPAPRCADADAGPDGDKDFGGCEDLSNAVRESLTVMLHQPCDLLPPGHEGNCQRRDVKPPPARL